jgi:hypothetical protein
MARKRNSERTRAPVPEDNSSSAPLAATSSPTDIFSFVTPTEFVDLPSKGRFYTEDSPLAGVETVEIRHMTAKEEDILTSESLLRKGLAIDRLLQSLLVDKGLDLGAFLVGDKNALVIASRITGFGSEYETTITCPACANASEATFDLESLTLKTAEELPEEVTATEGGTFTFTLPTTQVIAEVRLLTAGMESKLSAETARNKKMNLPDSRSTDLLKAVLVSVNGVTDAAMLKKFATFMPTKDARYLRKAYDLIKPDVDLNHEFTCETCSHSGKVVMPLTADFFWPSI